MLLKNFKIFSKKVLALGKVSKYAEVPYGMMLFIFLPLRLTQKALQLSF